MLSHMLLPHHSKGQQIGVQRVDLSGKWTIITGSNNGIGREAALTFASWGANLVLACRTPPENEADPAQVVQRCRGKASLSGHDSYLMWHEIDFASLNSVKSFAGWWLNTERPLDILCNNASTGGEGIGLTQDNFEPIHQVNFLWHVYLTLQIGLALWHELF
ncbi:hypothetical protein BBP40_009909 [Aspergillus hancockii]|nr:hypothetical protein BBP40_009909 [Aspergillus hancockii]